MDDVLCLLRTSMYCSINYASEYNSNAKGCRLFRGTQAVKYVVFGHVFHPERP